MQPEELLKKFADARRNLKVIQDRKKELLDEFKNSEPFSGVSNLAQELKDELDALRAEIETYALTEYKQTNQKRISGGAIGIRVKKVFSIGDTATVRAWALENAPVLMVVDNKALLNMAKSSVLPETIVSVEEKPTVTIASDLSKFV